MADAAVIEQRAARLREQAAALHKADSEAGAQAYRDVGRQKDDATQQLTAAREAAKAAQQQADQQHERAQDFEEQAQELELTAKDEFNQLTRVSESNLEQAQKLRALAAAASERAAENHRAVAKHTQEAQTLEQQIGALQSKVDIDGSPTEKLADQLDDMVDRLSHAAANLREADRQAAAGNPAGAVAMRGQADLELQRLGETTPDYRSVAADVLRRAGITPADTDLIDPTVLPDAPSTTSGTPDLMDPSAAYDPGDVLGADAVADATADVPTETAAEAPEAEPAVTASADDLASTSTSAFESDADGGLDPTPAPDALSEAPTVTGLDDDGIGALGALHEPADDPDGDVRDDSTTLELET